MRQLRRAAGGLLALLLMAMPVVAFAAPEVRQGADDGAASGASAAAGGNLELTDDDSGAALFTMPAMQPGEQTSQCLTVSYEGPQAATVLLRGTSGGELDRFLDMAVEVGQGGRYGDCSGFTGEPLYVGTLAGFAGQYGSGTAGLPTWDASGTLPSRSFRFTFRLADDQTASGFTSSPDFTWQVSVPEPELPASGSGLDAGSGPGPDPGSGASDDPDLRDGDTPPELDLSSTGVEAPAVVIKPHAAKGNTAKLAADAATGGKNDAPLSRILGSLAKSVAKIAPPVLKGSMFPLVLGLLVLAFFGIQNRIDRNDPKLENAPLYAEPELEFENQ
jgi:hypothetical protein